MKLSGLRFSIKTKLTIATLLPLAVAIFFYFLAGSIILEAKMAAQAREKVRSDLNVAREAYQSELSRVTDVVRFTAGFSSTAQAVDSGDREAVAQILSPVRQNEHLDLIGAVDASGRVICRPDNPSQFGDDMMGDQFVSRALRGEVVAGTTVLPVAALAREGSALLRQAQLAREALLHGGLFLMVAAPVRDRAGVVLGAIYGAVLLNNNHALADRISGVVYEGAPEREGGRASLFLGDLAIAGQLKQPAGGRGTGARLSGELYRMVLLRDTTWVGRTLAAGEWYLTAYQPIRSLQGVPIGALQVGIRESQYSAVKTDMAFLLSGVILVSGLIGLAVSGALAGRLAQPVKELAILARRLAAGEKEVRSQIASRDEIGELAESFNEMSLALREREDRIIDLNRNLEQKVELRTGELEDKNRLLVQTREELLRVEKLAAIGELAAGVAHEINNPMAIIRGNTELLQLSLPEEDPNREEVDTILAQVKRVERIVSSLLQFARCEQRAQGTVRLPTLLHRIVEQIGHQEPLDGISVVESYAPEVELVAGDADQLQQVFANLVLNAVQAMPKGGVLTVESSLGPEGEGYQVRVRDTGPGIPQEELSQIFNPFFTTKAAGTGLGLSVSYGIIKEHAGYIEVESAPGEGSCFCVSLPS